MKEGAGAGGAARGGAGRHPRGGDGGMIRKNDIMPCMHACICGKRKERRERREREKEEKERKREHLSNRAALFLWSEGTNKDGK